MEPATNHQECQYIKHLIVHGLRIELMEGSSSLEDIKFLELDVLTLELVRIIKEKCKYVKTLKLLNQINQEIFGAISEIKTITQINVTLLQHPRPQILKQFSHLNLCGGTFPKQIIEALPLLKTYGYIQKMSKQDIVVLQGMPNLKELKFHQLKFTDELMKHLTQSLPHLTSLSLRYCHISDQHMRIISQSIPLLRNIDFRCNDVTQEGIQHLTVYSKTLEKINISLNPIKQQGFRILSTHFQVLEEMEISLNKIIDGGIIHLTNGIQSLKKLYLLGVLNQYSSKVLSAINQFVHKKVKMEQLTIQYTYDNKTAQWIFQNLKSIRILKLYDGKMFNNTGCFYVSRIKTLKILNLYNNKLVDVGVNKILRNLKKSIINLRWNGTISQRTKRNMGIINQSSLMGLKQ